MSYVNVCGTTPIPFPFLLDRALLDSVIDRKVADIMSEAILSPSERYQNIQDNPEYNSVLPFRIILKIVAVNIQHIQHIQGKNFQDYTEW